MIKFVYQNKPLGTGDAVLKTKKFIKDKYFLMLLPDDLIVKRNCSKEMIRISIKNKCSVMASMKVKKNNVSRWGIYSVSKNLDKDNFFIKDVIEKPTIKKAPSTNAVIGRYRFCSYYGSLTSRSREFDKEITKKMQKNIGEYIY